MECTKFKTLMLGSSLWDYSDSYILVKGTITVPNTAASNNINKKVIFKNWAPFIDCLREINSKEIDHAKDIDVVMPMYNLIEHSDNYLETSGVYGNTIEINHLLTIMEFLLMFLMIRMVLHLNLSKK